MPVTARGVWTPDDNDDWDLIVDLAATANTIDTAITNALPRIASGTVSITPTGADTRTSVTVNFPAGRFTSPPRVALGFQTVAPNVGNVGVTSVTTTSCVITLYRTTVAATSVFWIAHQG